MSVFCLTAFIKSLYLEESYAAYYYDAILFSKSLISMAQLDESVMINTCLPIIFQLTSLSPEEQTHGKQ